MAARRNPDPPDRIDVQSLFDFYRRLSPQMQLMVICLLMVAGIAFAIAYFKFQRPVGTGPSASGFVSPQMLLGNPSNATADPSNLDNYLMVKSYYALSYNSAKGIPNWVSWQVTQADLGTAARKQEFDADTSLPGGFNIVTHQDYIGSGFDRGHMCPHSDRAANLDMSYATFVMTNIIPQAPHVNQKAWAQLESYSRELVSRGHLHLYITSGPNGQGGRGSKGFMQTLPRGRVVVPAECWKVIVAVPEDNGEDELSKISQRTRVITVLMPNDQDRVGEEWAQFRTTPSEIERKTGLHFFDRVRPDVAAVLRDKLDDESIPPPKPHHYQSVD